MVFAINFSQHKPLESLSHMHVLISMSLAVLIWSLYPLAATMGLQSMTSAELIFVVYFFSGFGAILMGGFYLWKNKTLKQAIQIQKSLPLNSYLTIIISGVAGILCHAFFIISLTMANKGGVSVLYESWPIIAVIATPFLIQKTWKEVSLKEFIASVIALIGVAIIILSDKNLSVDQGHVLSSPLNYKAIGGYILAFAGGYMCAILVVTKGAYAENFKTLNDDFGSTLISEIFSRLISMILMIIAFQFLSQEIAFENINWPAAFYIGFVVFVVGGALYTYGLLNSNNPTIHIMYYFVPILAVIWLWIAREADINTGLFIGAAIVVACNVYLFYKGRDTKPVEETS